ncbi:MAG: hypothetical protein K2J40_00305 [Ruminococcus sp.]|nr:hypothetical protein [Ruminococcus sp.]
MDMDKCVILKGIALKENVTIIGGIENGKIELKVIPEKLEKFFLQRFEIAYNSPEHLNYLHGYSPSGNVHKIPTLGCIAHIFCEHMLGRNPMTGEEIENSTEEIISLQYPEILRKKYDENTVF